MAVSKEHIRHVMLYEFNQGHSASAAARNITAVYGEDAVDVRKCQRWFQKFQFGDTSLTDKPREGRFVKLDNDVLQAAVKTNPMHTIEELATELHVTHSTVHRHLQDLGYVSKLGKWVPHMLTPQQKQQRVDICSSLLTRHRREPFLDRMVTGDEKWVLYHNITRKRQWVPKEQAAEPVPKPKLHPTKVMLSVWWDIRGIIHFEFLPHNQTINADVYCQQLERLRTALLEKRPALVNRKGVLIHGDNARPHTAKLTCTKIQEYCWEKIPHPAFSPDLAPTDYCLFRSLQNHLSGKTLKDDDDVRRTVTQFFASKTGDFFQRGIRQLVNRWQSVVDADGDYFPD